jgi:hypothetical protein
VPRKAWISLAVVTALLGTPGSAEAANKAWVGQTGSLAGDWNVGANWNPAGVPMPGDVVSTGADDEGRVTTLSGTAANVATVYGGAELIVDGTTLGRRVKVVRGRRLRAPVDLRSLPRGRIKVAVTVRLADGRSLRGTRLYRSYAKRQAR